MRRRHDNAARRRDAARPRTHLTYGFATQVCILDERRHASRRVVAAHDVGRVINRHMLEGQIEGAVHMGLGYALTEELPLANGVPESFKLRSLGLLRAHDMPEMNVIFVESTIPKARSAPRAWARSASCPRPARSRMRCTGSTACAATRCR